MQMSATRGLWNPPEACTEAVRLPGITTPLMECLSEEGKRGLWSSMWRALADHEGDPSYAVSIVESFWLTMRARFRPDYEESMKNPHWSAPRTLEEFSERIGL
jgi:hypothetical protein